MPLTVPQWEPENWKNTLLTVDSSVFVFHKANLLQQSKSAQHLKFFIYRSVAGQFFCLYGRRISQRLLIGFGPSCVVYHRSKNVVISL